MATFHLNGLAGASAFTAAIVFILGTAVLIRRRSLPHALFFLVTTAVSAWCSAFALLYGETSAQNAVIWARAGNLAACFIAPGTSFAAGPIRDSSRDRSASMTSTLS